MNGVSRNYDSFSWGYMPILPAESPADTEDSASRLMVQSNAFADNDVILAASAIVSVASKSELQQLLVESRMCSFTRLSEKPPSGQNIALFRSCRRPSSYPFGSAEHIRRHTLG